MLAFSATIDELKSDAGELDLIDEFTELEGEWNRLNDAISSRHEKLAKSFQIHKFLDECAEAASFISNRTEILINCEIPITVAQSEQALRNHERSFQEVKTFQSRIERLETQLAHIEAPVCTDEFATVQTKWKELNEAYVERERRIKEQLRLQRFDDAATSYLKWGNDLIAEMAALENPENEHQDRD